MKNISYFEAIALLVGAVVGAGFLGIPYVVAKVGVAIGLPMIVLIGLMVLVLFLAVTEITLRTHAKHQISGYISKYLGRRWRKFTFTVLIMGAYGTLLAYLVGEGQALAAIFGGNPLVYSVVFFVVTSFFVLKGLKTIEKVDFLLTMFMSVVVIVIGLLSIDSINYTHFTTSSFSSGILPAYGVILFSFMGTAAIPDMKLALKNQENRLASAVTIAAIIPVVIYVLFTLAVVGVNGDATSPIATIALGQELGRNVQIIGNALAVITMSTAYLGMALALKETFWYDLHTHKNSAFIFTVSVPLALLLLGLVNFTGILSVVGSLFGGLLGIFLVLTWWRAERMGDRKPEFILPHKKFFGFILIMVFLFGFIYSALNTLGFIA